MKHSGGPAGPPESGFGKEYGLEAVYQYTDQKSVVYGLV